MIARLQDYFVTRLPLFIRKRNEHIYFQLQIEIARDDGLCAGIYCEYKKIRTDRSLEEIGKIVKDMLIRFHELSDLSADEFKALTGFNDIESYDKDRKLSRIRFMDAKNDEDLLYNYEECSIRYILAEKKYNLGLHWVYQEGRKKWLDSSDSTGKQGILTFDEPLEFNDEVAPERLGEMIMEAFDRSSKMARIMTRGTGLLKEIDLLEGTILEVTSPKDKHFADYEDAGVGEIYQDYAYIAREGSESSADFLLTMAPEIYGDLCCENIRSAWIDAFGEADELDVKETEYGIYQYRAELKNKRMFRIAYFRELNDGTVLECCLEITSPSKKKKLTEKLPEMFEQFTLNCKILKITN